MRPIFWTGAADHISKYFVHNVRLQRICDVYPLYIVYSGASDYLKQYYPKANLIACTNDWMEKAIAVHAVIRSRSDYDFVVRFCPDTVIKDVDWLLRSIVEGMEGADQTAVGNMAVFNGVTYLRGACNTTPKRVYTDLVLQPNDRDYDTWYSMAVVAAGGQMKDHPLFEINHQYTGAFPVWHPTQYDMGHRDMDVRFKAFFSEMQ